MIRKFFLIPAMLIMGRSDGLLSCPERREGVSVVGRIGASLPYVKHLGLHYQIFEDTIELAFMPSTKATVRNEQIVEILEESIREIKELVERSE